MKICNACGKEYDSFGDDRCPHCGCINYDPVTYPDPLVSNLTKRVQIAGFRITVFSIFWIVCVNLIILACVGNAVLFSVTPYKVIWCQYAVAALLSAILLLRSIFSKKPMLMKNIRRIFYIIIVTLLIQLIQANTADDALILFLIIPSLLAAVSVTAGVLLLLRRCGNFGYLLTVSINTAVATVLAILMNLAPVKAGLVMPLHPIVTYVSLGICAFLLVNFLMLRIVTWLSKLKREE